jgi:hypothetical protein
MITDPVPPFIARRPRRSRRSTSGWRARLAGWLRRLADWINPLQDVAAADGEVDRG